MEPQTAASATEAAAQTRVTAMLKGDIGIPDKPQRIVVEMNDCGAVSADGIDDFTAYPAAVFAAEEQGKGVWFCDGEFECKADVIDLDHITICGAYMWHTTVKPPVRIRLRMGTGITVSTAWLL